MDKPLIEFEGLELWPLMPKHIFPFYENMSDETRHEFEFVYCIEPLRGLLDVLNDQMVYAVTQGDSVLSITGVDDAGVMWAIFSKDMRKNFKKFARGSFELIRFYHHFFPELRCIIWNESQMIYRWLQFIGFELEAEVTDGRVDFFQFVRCKDYEDNVHSFVSRPVMH